MRSFSTPAILPKKLMKLGHYNFLFISLSDSPLFIVLQTSSEMFYTYLLYKSF